MFEAAGEEAPDGAGLQTVQDGGVDVAADERIVHCLDVLAGAPLADGEGDEDAEALGHDGKDENRTEEQRPHHDAAFLHERCEGRDAEGRGRCQKQSCDAQRFKSSHGRDRFYVPPGSRLRSRRRVAGV